MNPTNDDLPGWLTSEGLPAAAAEPTGWPDQPDPAPVTPEPTRGSPRRGLRLVALVAVGALVGGAAGVAIGASLANPQTVVQVGSSTGAIVSPASNPTSFAAVAAHVLPSVVSITVTGDNQQDTGSGVILRANGYILTNNHVVAADEDNSGSVNVTFNDGSTAPATIVGYDAAYDLAVIKVARTGLDAATLGDSSTVRVGDPVLAVGSPLGLSGTVTSGIISALNRPVQTSQSASPFGGQGGATATVINAIQTDAPINPGNSGGPLVDMAGQVIGINSAIATVNGGVTGQSGNIGLGFSIPIDQARTTAAQLIATGHASHPILGVSVTDATDNSGLTQVLVQAVTPGGPAASAGIRTGDLIVRLDGHPVADSDALIATIRSDAPGENVSVTVVRGGTQRTFTVRLGNSASSQG